ncbi:hypothetical protein N781_08620 [Pontibacillus halophilus JSM 076056 = DSM 19796]|uniref:Methyltransferase small domain-containing protein n=1 Tax=Pontibacillus halophilus JSM 076056 = DSM 19796 TaxID=1385510 RepID=A0A0A5GDP5_9BACI|nr:tRNA1(Val) (adenine(37)-N6)-methyltransferase [Pontibacillus halophilus]KGX90099.1 hypothetical protein N781_08620 [Pontibacillus halophilus JSM 076056 = DSM 19796]
MVQLREDERLDYLLAEEEIRIIQSPTVFSFSLDAVLLGNFAGVPVKRGKILDVCSGNGVIPLFLTRRSNAQITGVEIQERLVDMARRTMEYNKLQEQVDFVHGDIRDMPKLLGNGKFDMVTCNPPYFQTPKVDQLNENEHHAIARHEIHGDLESIVKSIGILARSGGKVAMVHRPNRLIDLIELFRKYKIEPKRIRLVHPKHDKEANMVLIEGMRDGKPDVKLLPPLYVYHQDGTYTEEMQEILYGK